MIVLMCNPHEHKWFSTPKVTMRDRYNRGYRYRLTSPPEALLNARLDNIAIVPARMLPLTETLKEKVNTLPQGGVLLCYAQENSRQRKTLERVEETFREQGYAVKSMSVGEVIKLLHTCSSCIWVSHKHQCATQRCKALDQKTQEPLESDSHGAADAS